LRSILDADPTLVEEGEGGEIKRLVLDGEVCVMVPSESTDSRIADDGTGASALWENDGLVEDFTSAVSAVKRHATMDNPLYFVFDLLSWAEVYALGGLSGDGLGKTFGDRAEDVRQLAEWFRSEIKEKIGEEPKVWALVQWQMQPGDEDAMVERASQEGWEGLIFRADVPYKGKRS
jgi:DNA ligase-1